MANGKEYFKRTRDNENATECRRPWQTIACDLFEDQNKDYLIAVDCYSHFFEVGRLQQPEVLS